MCEWIRVKHVGLINQWDASCMLKHTTEETCQHRILENLVSVRDLLALCCVLRGGNSVGSFSIWLSQGCCVKKKVDNAVPKSGRA